VQLSILRKFQCAVGPASRFAGAGALQVTPSSGERDMAVGSQLGKLPAQDGHLGSRLVRGVTGEHFVSDAPNQGVSAGPRAERGRTKTGAERAEIVGGLPKGHPCRVLTRAKKTGENWPVCGRNWLRNRQVPPPRKMAERPENPRLHASGAATARTRMTWIILTKIYNIYMFI
jgi:hypothetical protein